MSPSPKVIILTGAPSARSLKWNEAHLNAPLRAPFDEYSAAPSWHEKSEKTPERPVWRVLPLKAKHIPTGLTQETPLSVVGVQGPRDIKAKYRLTEFLDLQSLSSQEENEVRLSQFLERSFALHKEAPSSQLQHLSDHGSQSTITTTGESFTISGGPASQPLLKTAPEDALKHQLIALKDVPSASVIVSLRPQKLMRSLIVVVLSVPPTRPCKNCWGHYSRPADRLELTVADETRSGFGVTLWLPPVCEPAGNGDGEQQGREMNTSVWSHTFCYAARGLELRDIILLQDVTLTEYRGKVYANSREGFSRIELLFRQAEDGKRKAPSVPQRGRYRLKDLEKTKTIESSDYMVRKASRVWNWLISFVGLSLDMEVSSTTKKRRIGEHDSDDDRARRRRREAQLPPDTPSNMGPSMSLPLD